MDCQSMCTLVCALQPRRQGIGDNSVTLKKQGPGGGVALTRHIPSSSYFWASPNYQVTVFPKVLCRDLGVGTALGVAGLDSPSLLPGRSHSPGLSTFHLGLAWPNSQTATSPPHPLPWVDQGPLATCTSTQVRNSHMQCRGDEQRLSCLRSGHPKATGVCER